jgi:hypothetical protein
MRYWVDVRVGCCAIRDSRISGDELDVILNPNLPSVIYFWAGSTKVVKTEHGEYLTPTHCQVPEEELLYARKLCEELNEQDKNHRMAAHDAMVGCSRTKALVQKVCKSSESSPSKGKD